MVNYVKVFGAIVLSDVLVDSDGHSNNALAGSPGGQTGSTESGLGMLSHLTGALGGGAGDLAQILDRVKEGGGGTIGNVNLQTQSGGNAGGNNGGVVGELLLGDNAGDGFGLGNLLASAISANRADQDTPITITELQDNHARYLLDAMFNAAASQPNPLSIDFDSLSQEYPALSDEDMAFIKDRAQLKGESDGTIKVPAGLEQQTYVLSALSVNMASEAAQEKLKQLASKLDISSELQQQIHTDLGLALVERQTLGGSPV